MAQPTRESILEELRGLVQLLPNSRAEVGALTLDARLVEDLGLDSIALLSLVVEVENRFEICLDPEEEGQIVTVGDMVDLIAGRPE